MMEPHWRPRPGQAKEPLAKVEIVPNGTMTHLRHPETGQVESFFERDEELDAGSRHEYDPLEEADDQR